jgi:excisionase family DNA binding protein
MTDILLKGTQAAERLAVCENTLRKLAAGGAIPRVRVGRAVRYRESDVARIIRTGVPATASGARP